MFKDNVSKSFSNFWEASEDYGRVFQELVEANPKLKEL